MTEAISAFIPNKYKGTSGKGKQRSLRDHLSLLSSLVSHFFLCPSKASKVVTNEGTMQRQNHEKLTKGVGAGGIQRRVAGQNQGTYKKN